MSFDGPPREFWRTGVGLNNITPKDNPEPEGAGFGKFLVKSCGPGRVLDFGCGVGRLAKYFEPVRYHGVDICGAAIDIATTAEPAHSFSLLGHDLPKADVTLAHTVLLHVPDDEIAVVIARFNSPRVVVSEILGRRWRREGDPPVFNREKRDYQDLFRPAYRFTRSRPLRYRHYWNTDLTVMQFARR